MHEYAITQNMVVLVIEQAQKSGATKVVAINLVVGELSSMVPECIELFFEPLSKGTIAEGAKLNFKCLNAELKCKVCEKVFPKKENGIECPECGGSGVFTDQGYEFYLESIEVE